MIKKLSGLGLIIFAISLPAIVNYLWTSNEQIGIGYLVSLTLTSFFSLLAGLIILGNSE